MSSVREVRDGVLLLELGDALNKEAFAEYLQVLDDCIAADKAFVMVIDGSSPPLALTCTPPRRWQLDRAVALGRLHKGIAFVTGTMTRERMQALYAMQVPGVAYAFLPAREEALSWAQAAIDGERKRAVSQRKTVPFMQAIR